MHFAAIRAVDSSTAGCRKRDLQTSRGALEHLNPVGSLERGYAIVRTGNGAVVTDSTDAKSGDSLQIILHRGAIDATVVGTRAKNELSRRF